MAWVKICGVTSVEDARIAASAGAAAIGLNFYRKSPRYVSPESAMPIVEALPAGICKVGVFVDEDRQRIVEIAEKLQLDALQFHGRESVEFCRGWSQKLVKAVRVRGPQALRSSAPYPVDFILADAYVEGRVGGTGQQIPLDWLAGIDRSRLILAGGLKPENVAEVIQQVRPAGVDVASGVEKEPGRKDPDLLRKFIENAKNA
jgi:phosphoribosylanthranilate isomerase